MAQLQLSPSETLKAKIILKLTKNPHKISTKDLHRILTLATQPMLLKCTERTMCSLVETIRQTWSIHKIIFLLAEATLIMVLKQFTWTKSTGLWGQPLPR